MLPVAFILAGSTALAQEAPAPALTATEPPAISAPAIEPATPVAPELSAPEPAETEALDPDAPIELGEPLELAEEIAVETGGPLLPDEMSPLGMFLNADIVVKLVMIGLAFASVLTWTIAFAKTMELASEIRRARLGRRWLGEASSLEHSLMRFENASKSDVVANLARAAMEEIRLSPRSGRDSLAGIKERVQSRLERIEFAAGRHAARSTGLLATIGSTAPFVGLFGTVWGIMNSFIGISKAQTTNLAVVAPGIAEALLATAIGLVAAIPAVVIYNMFARRTSTYRAVLGDASAEILRHVSRDAERWPSSSQIAAE